MMEAGRGVLFFDKRRRRPKPSNTEAEKGQENFFSEPHKVPGFPTPWI